VDASEQGEDAVAEASEAAVDGDVDVRGFSRVVAGASTTSVTSLAEAVLFSSTEAAGWVAMPSSFGPIPRSLGC
jgi:hypothetical protein